MQIIVDTREPEQQIGLLATIFPHHQFARRALPEGDYRTESVICERKTIPDLYSSLMGSGGKPGRLINQIERLSSHEEMIIFLIIGDVDAYVCNMTEIGVDVNPNIIYGTVASLMCREGFHVIWSLDEYSGLSTMVKCMEKVNMGDYLWPSRRNPEVLMARYLKLTLKQTKTLKIKFGDISGILRASDLELMKINGIGKVKARNIKNLLTEGW